ncbi:MULTISPECIES: glycosyltransferase family 2 protein [unclassified Lysobacter]|uniref:glycosyltransferase family 2 protein n=1 Tax=unclassified Lysobacter TaxID=2635362 RepID=UPI001BEAD97A|nr:MULTISPECIES: glycosyltransferase family 2 protein [unclassified Lysobacter]MBT2747456.1 glycosyltransferase family 2 protein [Lysobacter sp. ISL-42]MBT2752702.1 glycosyltransferase family 2 protein [Lysobacter sp. ISL-50]MBT2778359.1 glycosyltransferase family 2 protein [Lysobacter sp. ISL-54]MBT2783877.1 glycosyltransferase family 2 protein [Lysobacter sp. ISL-52]
MNSITSLALVVPMFNEAQNIDRFIDRTGLALAQTGLRISFVFVDDGSSDDSVARVVARLPHLPGSAVVQLTRNFGKEAALLAGLDAAISGDCDAVVMIDADLQHPPEAIPMMIEEYRNGNDVVIASRASRTGDSLLRRGFTKLFYKSINWLADIPIVDGDGDFRLLGREVVEAICSLREQHRFTKGLYSWVGFRQLRIPVEYETRNAGSSKFRYGHLLALALNAITSFSAKPLRVALVVGFVIGVVSLTYAIWIALQTIGFGKDLPGYASIFCGMMFLGGMQLIGIGLLGEYVGRTYIESKARPPYLIRRVVSKRIGESADN